MTINTFGFQPYNKDKNVGLDTRAEPEENHRFREENLGVWSWRLTHRFNQHFIPLPNCPNVLVLIFI